MEEIKLVYWYTRVIWEQMDGADVTFSKFIKRFLKFYQNYNFI